MILEHYGGWLSEENNWYDNNKIFHSMLFSLYASVSVYFPDREFGLTAVGPFIILKAGVVNTFKWSFSAESWNGLLTQYL